MNWMMRAISAPCRIASPRLQSEERRLISSRSRDFSRNRAWRRIRHSTPREFPTRASVRAPNDRAGFANRQDRQGNRFPDRVLRPDRPFSERTEGYRDNRHGRDGRPRDFRPYRDSPAQATREGGADGRGIVGPSALHHCEPKAAQTRIRPQTRLRPMQSLPPRPSGRPRQVPLFSSSRQAKAAFRPGPDAGGYDRHMDLAGVIRENRSGPNSTPEITDDSPVTE